MPRPAEIAPCVAHMVLFSPFSMVPAEILQCELDFPIPIAKFISAGTMENGGNSTMCATFGAISVGLGNPAEI